MIVNTAAVDVVVVAAAAAVAAGVHQPHDPPLEEEQRPRNHPQKQHRQVEMDL